MAASFMLGKWVAGTISNAAGFFFVRDGDDLFLGFFGILAVDPFTHGRHMSRSYLCVKAV